MAADLTMKIITLNVTSVNIPVKRQRWSDGIKDHAVFKNLQGTETL